MRGVVGVGGHDVGHMPPPFMALRQTGDGLPAAFVLNLEMGKELANRHF
ncbi:hypothetical protein MCEMIH22_00667 [Candidatus Methylacidiphilaceae bacterium]|jgi:hypothetical protein